MMDNTHKYSNTLDRQVCPKCGTRLDNCTSTDCPVCARDVPAGTTLPAEMLQPKHKLPREVRRKDVESHKQRKCPYCLKGLREDGYCEKCHTNPPRKVKKIYN